MTRRAGARPATRGDRRRTAAPTDGRRSLPRFVPSRPRLGRIVTPGRAGGLLGMLATGYLWSAVTGATAFAVEQIDAPALRWTDEATIAASLAGVTGTNLFWLETAPLEERLAALPAVRSAQVTVSLVEATVLVRMDEREPVLGWHVGETVYLVDRDGVIVATRGPDEHDPPLPTVEDRRRGAADGLAVGARLDPTDSDVATRLGSLLPADVGSAAAGLEVIVTDRDGYVVRTARWDAVFGFYGPATRSPQMIAGQVRLLRSLLADREGGVRRVILASDTDGTYVPRPTPRPTSR